jgi:hypothetical protein
MTRRPENLRKKAIAMRRSETAVGVIAKHLGLSKSTVSLWVRKMPQHKKIVQKNLKKHYEAQRIHPPKEPYVKKKRLKNGPYLLVRPPKGYPGKRYRGIYAYEHHVVYWRMQKIIPTALQVVHHKNHDTRDNRPSNLELISRSAHNRYHSGTRRAPPVEFACNECGILKIISKRYYDARVKKNNGRMYCSIKCGAVAFQKRRRALESLEVEISTLEQKARDLLASGNKKEADKVFREIKKLKLGR